MLYVTSLNPVSYDSIRSRRWFLSVSHRDGAELKSHFEKLQLS